MAESNKIYSFPKKTFPENMESDNYPKWNFWQVLFLILIIYFIELALGWLNPPVWLDNLHDFLHYLFICFGDGFLSIVMVGIFLKLLHMNFSDIGFGNFKFRHILLGLFAGVLLFLGVGYFGNLLTKVFGEPELQSFALAIDGADAVWQLVLLVILGGILIPIKEEMIFRGLIFPPLKRAYGSGKGIWITALFFAAFHFDLIRFLPIMLGGLVLTWLYNKTSSIIPSIIAHGTWNILMLGLMWMQKS
ncbi:MAG: type II CAAX endopeptidase family protein [Eubacteriales bacterium]